VRDPGPAREQRLQPECRRGRRPTFSAASAWNALRAWPPNSAFSAGQVAARAELAAMFVDHAEVHEQVRRHLLELEVVALHRHLRALAHRLQQHVDQAALAEGVRLDELGGEVGQRHQARARALVQALHSASTLSFSMPGTSHSQRSSLTWLSA
jgi:hypothetical protein